MTILQAMIKMTKIGLTTGVILAFTVGCASQGASTAPVAEATTAMNVDSGTNTVATAPVEEKSTKLVCRKIKPTGSRFGERICMRPEQWAKYAGHAKKETERIQSQALTNNPPGGK